MRRLSHFAEIILDDLGICGSFDEGIVNKDIDAPLFQKTGNRKRAYGDAKTRPLGKPIVLSGKLELSVLFRQPHPLKVPNMRIK